MAKKPYKPTEGDRNEALGGFERTEFTPCTDCPNPSSCERAGRCLMNDYFSPKETMKRIKK